ncbi:MAG: CrcB family protein [Flaviflexus sp.]|nr:CrcB family protein [Flaviflexus sp.]
MKENFADAGAVAVGGAIGAALRFGILTLIPFADWPLATFLTNMAGCLILGFVTAAVFPDAHPRLKLLIGTGLLGGFTTYSTFMVETLHLSTPLAFSYVAATIIIGLGAAHLGLSWGERRRISATEGAA